MVIICNGKEQDVESGASLNDLIVSLDLNPSTVVAECNGVIVRREEYNEYRLNKGDKVELIRFVGGG